MIDSTVIEVRSGNGGHGMVSFIREALLPRGGPGGGDGGHGGDIVLVADSSINTLQNFTGNHISLQKTVQMVKGIIEMGLTVKLLKFLYQSEQKFGFGKIVKIKN